MSKLSILLLCLVTLFLCTESFSGQYDGVPTFQSPLLVKRDQRKPIVATEFGEISAVQIANRYQIQFITLEPNALLLPLLLHSDMVFFVHTGSGILSWIDEEKERTLKLRGGDVFRLRSGTVFYVHSTLERDEVPEKLRVYAIFDVGKCLYDPCLGAYSNIRDLLLGFNEKTLRSAFAVPENVLGKVRDASKPPLITKAMPRNRTLELEEETWQSRLVKLFVRVEDVTDHLAMKPVVNSKKKKSSAYNVFEADPDFKNVNGQSIVVDDKDMDALKGSSFGVYMVYLMKGSMMEPHWNPDACEISIVLRGKGMIRVVNNYPWSQSMNKSESERFMVEEGDVFIVPQFHPMAQMSFVNSSFMFMGFSTWAKTNLPQFLIGQSSVLKVIDRDVLATSFNVRNETIERLMGAQKEGVMLECVACAEVELSRLMREIEERKRREEEETERRRKEEEAARKRAEERKREEEAAKRREEERRKREEEEIERKRKEEEEARKRAEERKREEEAAKRREEERRKREVEAEEARKREEAREREEEKAKKQEEERRRHEKEEEEEARKKEEQRGREEEEAKKREEERIRREKEKEAARKREEEREKEEAMAKRREEERQRKEREEAEMKRREEQERKRREEEAMMREKEMQREEMAKREEDRKREEAAAKRAEEERRRREEEEEKRWPPSQPQPPIDH